MAWRASLTKAEAVVDHINSMMQPYNISYHIDAELLRDAGGENLYRLRDQNDNDICPLETIGRFFVWVDAYRKGIKVLEDAQSDMHRRVGIWPV